MSPRRTPTPERFVELLNQFAAHQGRDADTQAIPMGGGGVDGGGLVEWVKIHERTMPARAADWITQTALGDEPPFYLARQRDGQLTITRPHPTGMVERLAMTAAELGLCDADVSACLMIDTRGRFYNKITPEGLADSCAQWLITPEAMTHLIAQAAQVARELAETSRAALAAHQARADELAGTSLDIIRGLLMAAGIGLDALDDAVDTVPTTHAERVTVHISVAGANLTKLADTLAAHGVTPVTRAQAANPPPEGGGYAWTEWLAAEMGNNSMPDAVAPRKCPDDGACHHECTRTCFRVRHCEPLSGVFPGDTWPEGIHARHTAPAAEPIDQGARFRQAQQTRIVKLSADVADRPVHAQFLADLLDAPPGTDLDDVERPPGLSHGLARALIEDVTWCRRPAPEPGCNIPSFPGAYTARRLRTARAAATRNANKTEAPESFTPSGLAELLDLDRKA